MIIERFWERMTWFHWRVIGLPSHFETYKLSGFAGSTYGSTDPLPLAIFELLEYIINEVTPSYVYDARCSTMPDHMSCNIMTPGYFIPVISGAGIGWWRGKGVGAGCWKWGERWGRAVRQGSGAKEGGGGRVVSTGKKQDSEAGWK